MKTIEIAGRRFGRLSVLHRSPQRRSKDIDWVCLCDCGNQTIALSGNLRRGKTASCGCIKLEHLAVIHAQKTTHGMSLTAEYKIWGGMIDRCTNQNSKDFANYGARGIFVCEEWLDFTSFYSDMGARPAAKLSVEREDNNGPYAPWNCKWGTKTEQRRNSRQRVHTVTLNGETMALVDWAKRTGIPKPTLISRIKRGLPPKLVLMIGHL